MNCPQEECEGCPYLSGCEKPQSWDYRAELDAEARHDPVADELERISDDLAELRGRYDELRRDFDRVIAAVRKATVEEVE